MLKNRIVILIFLFVMLLSAGTATATEPFAKYHFDEGSGTVAVDTSGYGHNGTINGAAWVERDGGYAIDLDDTPGSNIVIPDSSVFDFTNQSFSVAFVLNNTENWETNDEFNNIISKAQATYTTTDGWTITKGRYGTGTGKPLEWTPRNGTSKETVSGYNQNWDTGTDHGYAVVYNHTERTTYFFKDGVLVDTDTLELSGTIAVANTRDVIIGYGLTSASGIDGIIDEIEFYDVALSTEEAMAVSDKGQTAPPTNPIVTTEYYVANGAGSDGNDGLAPETAFQTVEYACSQMDSGDILYVYGGEGIYYDDYFDMRTTGLHHAQIIGINGTPVFDFMGKEVIGNWSYVDNYTISNMEWYNFTYGFYGGNQDNITLSNLTIHDGQDAVTFWRYMNNTTVHDCRIYNMTAHGIHFWQQDKPEMCYDLTIVNNNISDCSHNMIDIHTNVSRVNVSYNDVWFSDGWDMDDNMIVFHNGGTDYLSVVGNHVYNGQRAFEFSNSKHVVFRDNIIEDIVGGSANNGLRLAGAGITYDTESGIENFTAINNTFTNCDIAIKWYDGGYAGTTFKYITFNETTIIGSNTYDVFLISGTFENIVHNGILPYNTNFTHRNYDAADITPTSYYYNHTGGIMVDGVNQGSSWSVPDSTATYTISFSDVEGSGTSDYFTGNTSLDYIGYAKTYTWSSGAFVISFPNDGTVLAENAPAVITGVEVHP